MDFKSLSVHRDPTLIVQCLNEIIDTFDKIGDNYDVFKVETKADASYMVVAGLSDRLNVASFGSITLSVKLVLINYQSLSCISNSHLRCMLMMMKKMKK